MAGYRFTSEPDPLCVCVAVRLSLDTIAIDSDDEEQQNDLFQSTLQQSDSCSASTGEESDSSSMKVITLKINQTKSLFCCCFASQLPTHGRNCFAFLGFVTSCKSYFNLLFRN